MTLFRELSDEQIMSYRPFLGAIIPTAGLLARARYLAGVQTRMTRYKTFNLDHAMNRVNELSEWASAEKNAIADLADFMKQHANHLVRSSELESIIPLESVHSFDYLLKHYFSRQDWDSISCWREEVVCEEDERKMHTVTRISGLDTTYYEEHELGAVHLTNGLLPIDLKSGVPTSSCPESVAQDVIESTTCQMFKNTSFSPSEPVRKLRPFVQRPSSEFLSHCAQHRKGPVRGTIRLLQRSNLDMNHRDAILNPSRVRLITTKQFTKTASLQWTFRLELVREGQTLADAEQAPVSTFQLRIIIHNTYSLLMSHHPRVGELMLACPLLYTMHSVLQMPLAPHIEHNVFHQYAWMIRPLASTSQELVRKAKFCLQQGNAKESVHVRSLYTTMRKMWGSLFQHKQVVEPRMRVSILPETVVKQYE